MTFALFSLSYCCLRYVTVQLALASCRLPIALTRLDMEPHCYIGAQGSHVIHMFPGYTFFCKASQSCAFSLDHTKRRGVYMIDIRTFFHRQNPPWSTSAHRRCLRRVSTIPEPRCQGVSAASCGRPATRRHRITTTSTASWPSRRRMRSRRSVWRRSTSSWKRTEPDVPIGLKRLTDCNRRRFVVVANVVSWVPAHTGLTASGFAATTAFDWRDSGSTTRVGLEI